MILNLQHSIPRLTISIPTKTLITWFTVRTKSHRNNWKRCSISNEKPATITQCIFLQHCSTCCQTMPCNIYSSHRARITKKVKYHTKFSTCKLKLKDTHQVKIMTLANLKIRYKNLLSTKNNIKKGKRKM